MKAILYVFSGTGHTLIATKQVAAGLIARGFEVDVYRIRRENSDVPNPNDYDIVGIGYPIHAFNAPQIVCRFVKKLPKVEKKNLFFYKTSGEPFALNSSSSVYCWRRLKRKGYKLVMDVHMLMPYNIMFRYKDELAKQMYLYTCAMSEMIAEKISKQDYDKVKYKFGYTIVTSLLRLQWFGAWVNGPLIFAKKKICNKCGLCVKQCPAGNITMTEKGVKFHGKCTMCMCCAFHCPKDAIRPGFLNPWRVNGAYPFEKLVNNKEIASDYVRDDTKGYFKLFRKYFHKVDDQLAKYGIEIKK